MLACPNVRGFELQSIRELLDRHTRERPTPRSLLLRCCSCVGYFNIHSARKRAYGRFSSLVVRACIWERESLSFSPCFNEPDIEKLTMKAALLILPARSVSKIICQSPKCWGSGKYICVFGLFLFPFWAAALERQVFKLYLMTMTRVRKSCVHKPFSSLCSNPLGGSFSSSFFLAAPLCPLAEQTTF